MISIIIPTLNEEARIGQLLTQLQRVCTKIEHEIIIIDANSQDQTVAIARAAGVQVVVVNAANRGAQLQRGVKISRGDYLWFLHADVTIDGHPHLLERLMKAVNRPHCAAVCLRLAYHDRGFFYRFLEITSNWRARHLGLIFGDQGLFVSRKKYDEVGGFSDVPLMEDWIFSRKLYQVGCFLQLPDRLYASDRKYVNHPWQVHVKLLWIKLLFICGVSPKKLVQIYYGKE